MNNSIIRIEKIVINGFKNVLHGEIVLNEYNALLKEDFNYKDSLLGLYGQNGSGKTAVIESTTILKNVLMGKSLRENIGKYINNETKEVSLEYTFYMQYKELKMLLTYIFTIGESEGEYDIVYEKMTAKRYCEEKQKWDSQITLFEVDKNEIILQKLKNKISEKRLMELVIRKEVQRGTSLFFNKKNRDILIDELQEKEEKILMLSLVSLNIFASLNLIIIGNDEMGSKAENNYLPINVYLEDSESIWVGGVTVNLLEKNELDISIWEKISKIVEQIDVVLNSIIPELHLKIINSQDVILEDGEPGKSFEVVSIRNNKEIPLKYESEGIKRIISVTSSLIAAYNYSSMFVMIDEFDSGIFEYLLGELLEMFEESGKGQLVFTSHNLRPLEKISYKSIIFTTTNPNNRYIRLKKIKSNNNVRDVYYNSIMLGGQDEELYVETKNHTIKRAFRKAGKMNG
jgi:predicted ATPase